MIKDENFITIQGWMRGKLELKGNELLIYALIYGFSQDQESSFSGSQSYIAEWIGGTRGTVNNTLKKLTEKGLLKKNESAKNGIKFCDYQIVHPVQNLYRGCTKIVQEGCTKIVHNNIYKDNIKDIYSNFSFFLDEFRKIWLEEFIPLKKKKKASISDRALTSQLNKIKKFSNDNYELALSILEKSVNSGWTDFYEPKKDFKQLTITPATPNYQNLENYKPQKK